MSKKLSESKVSAALKGAAHDAVHGSRDVRSGRFLATTGVKDKPTPSRSGSAPEKG
jgi:hypothetical protein